MFSLVLFDVVNAFFSITGLVVDQNDYFNGYAQWKCQKREEYYEKLSKIT